MIHGKGFDKGGQLLLRPATTQNQNPNDITTVDGGNPAPFGMYNTR